MILFTYLTRDAICRHWAVSGAFITILLLGFEPFLQSVIYYDGRMEPLGTSPTPPLLGRSMRLDAGVYRVNDGQGLSQYMLPTNRTIPIMPFTSQPDLGMLAALFDGFYNRSTVAGFSTAFSCPSGNCTWAPFTSIAACESCNDVTGSLDRRVMTGNNLGTIVDSMAILGGDYLIYSLPYLNLSNSVTERRYAAYMAATPRMQPTGTVSFKHLKTMIMAIGVIKADASYAGGGNEDTDATPWNKTAVTATECALYFCTNAYESEVRNGELRERVIASWANRNMDSYKPIVSPYTTDADVTAYEEHFGYPLWNDDTDLIRKDLELQIPADEARQSGLLVPPSSGGDGPADSPLSFTITQNTIGSMMQYLSQGFFKGYGQMDDGRGGDEEPPLVWPHAGTRGRSSFQPPVVQALYESTDLPTMFASVARTLSDWMRNRPAPSSSYSSSSSSSYSDATNSVGKAAAEETQVVQAASSKADGIAFEYIMHIKVDWGYLSLPVATIIAGCLFVLCSILETRRLGLDPWKTDVMASLIHSLDPETRARLRRAEAEAEEAAAIENSRTSHDRFHKIAEATIVGLEERGDGDHDHGGPQLRAVQNIPVYMPATAPGGPGSGGAASPSPLVGR